MLYCSPRRGKLSALFYLVLPVIYGGVTFPVLARRGTQRRVPSAASAPGTVNLLLGGRRARAGTGDARGAGWQRQPKSMGWDGMRWDGMGWDALGCVGMGWDAMGWDALGWDGM